MGKKFRRYLLSIKSQKKNAIEEALIGLSTTKYFDEILLKCDVFDCASCEGDAMAHAIYSNCHIAVEVIIKSGYSILNSCIRPQTSHLKDLKARKANVFLYSLLCSPLFFALSCNQELLTLVFLYNRAQEKGATAGVFSKMLICVALYHDQTQFVNFLLDHGFTIPTTEETEVFAEMYGVVLHPSQVCSIIHSNKNKFI